MRTKMALAALALAVVTSGVAQAKKLTYKLPAEKSSLKKTDDPGYQNADNLCSACHSRDYIATQPRGKGKDFWTAEVNKMVTVYGAPIAEANRPAIAEYLAQNY